MLHQFEVLMSLFCLLAFQCLLGILSAPSEQVDVYHFVSRVQSAVIPDESIKKCAVDCHWIVFDSLKGIDNVISESHRENATQMTLYNIHSWNDAMKTNKPNRCKLPVLSVAESEDSIETSFPYFDGYSTTNMSSHIPRNFFIASNNSRSNDSVTPLDITWHCRVCKWGAAHSHLYSNVSRKQFCGQEQQQQQRMRGSSGGVATLATEQIYSLVCLLVVSVVLVVRTAVKLWCPQWLLRGSASRHH